jgi:hypothetical protein
MALTQLFFKTLFTKIKTWGGCRTTPVIQKVILKLSSLVLDIIDV